MRLRKIMYIFVLAVFVLTACGKETEEQVKSQQEETEQSEESRDGQEDLTESFEAKDEDSQSVADAPNGDEVQEPSNDAEHNTSSNNDTITKPSTGNNNTTTKPSTGSGNNNSGSTGNSGSTNNSGSTGSTGSANNSGATGNTQNNNSGTTTQPVHEHKWTEVTEDEIHYYAWRTICGKCGEDLTDLGDDGITYHSAVICHNGYTVKFIEVDYITENVQKEPIVTGYKCECGAEKK